MLWSLVDRRFWLTVCVACTGTTAAQSGVVISADSTTSMSCSAGVCTPTAKNAVLNVSDLGGMLASGDIAVESGSQAKDIEVDAALSWVSTSKLTLNASRSITFEKELVVAGSGALEMSYDGLSGDLQFHKKGRVEFWDLTSDLTINGNDYVLVRNIKALALDIRRGDKFLALAKNYNGANRRPFTSSPVDDFSGTFEGLGNTISNVRIVDSNNLDNVGLFGELETSGGGGLIRDIGVEKITVTGSGTEQRVGGLVGYNLGIVMNSFVSGTISSTKAQSFAGGLVGASDGGTILRSHSTASVTGIDGEGGIGGLAGGTAGFCVGGCFGKIDRSFATGTVTGGGNTPVGGLVGKTLGGSISNSYALGQVTGGSNASVGGLIGANTPNVDEQDSEPTLSNAYSIGSVSGGSDASVGGLIGSDTAAPGISNAYWDLDTSGVSDPTKGAGDVANDPGITGLTDTQLKSVLPPGFDKKVWRQKGGINAGYPYLIDVTPL